jgi:hypothetical protein
VIECVPTDSDDIESVAFVPWIATDPSALLPSENVTVIVAVQHGETAAVRVTDCPKVGVLAVETSVVVTFAVTNCVIVPEELPKVASPL